MNLFYKKNIFILIMTSLTNEYLDNMIKKKIFKDFNEWNKNDFHFLLSLLNYPSYTNLALIMLVNLRNWITYDNGDFFYPLDKLQKILDKYYLNNDILEQINKEENIKLNIHKKKNNTESNIDNQSENNDNINLISMKKEKDFIDFNIDNGFIQLGDFLSIDTFQFFTYVILFFIIFAVLTLFSSYNNQSKYDRYLQSYKNLFPNNYNADIDSVSNKIDDLLFDSNPFSHVNSQKNNNQTKYSKKNIDNNNLFSDLLFDDNNENDYIINDNDSIINKLLDNSSFGLTGNILKKLIKKFFNYLR